MLKIIKTILNFFPPFSIQVDEMGVRLGMGPRLIVGATLGRDMVGGVEGRPPSTVSDVSLP